MSIERQRARLLRRIAVLEATQDTLYFVAGLFGAAHHYFNNLASTAKIVEIDAAKRYRALTGTAVREIDGSLVGNAAASEDA